VNAVDYLIVFGFIGLTFYVGSVFYKWVGSADDFYVAGRKLTPFILAAVLTATNVNLYSFVGQAGIVYREGIGILWQTWTGNMALVFSGLFVLPIFRRLRIKTIPEFLELRYTKSVRTFVALIWIVRLTFWLGVISYTAAIAAIPLTGWDSFTGWILIFSLVAIAYTTLGGMWSVAFTDVMQFVFMLLGALIVLPLAMAKVGWWPALVQQLPEQATTLVAQSGSYNWKFILAIFLLGIEWACVDQGLLQRAFAAENTKTVARGLVLAGIVTTPFALLWNLPGLAARVLYPGLANADSAIPTLLANLLPNIVLGVVVCGLISSHLSTISANLNGVATIVASDLYESVVNRRATDREILRVARWVTALTGVVMIAFAHLVPKLGGAVEAYLTIVAIMDMPLFIIAVVYGLLWRRANAVGALTGYMAGAASGIVGMFGLGFDFNLTTFLSAGVTLLVTPVVSALTKHNESATIDAIWSAKTSSAEEDLSGTRYDILPRSASGKLSLGLLGFGLLMFFGGVLLGSTASPFASPFAVGGMVLYFAGGLWRAYAD
jgi:SSS family solute:Na+ symporter